MAMRKRIAIFRIFNPYSAKSTPYLPFSQIIAKGFKSYAEIRYPSAVSDTVNSAIPPLTHEIGRAHV